MQHDAVSELIPTRMASAVRDDILRVTGQHSLSQIPPASTSQSEAATVTTSVAVRRPSRTGMMAAIAATVVAVAAVVFFLSRTKSNADPVQGAGQVDSVKTAEPKPTAQPTQTATVEPTTEATATAAPSATATDTSSATAEAADDKKSPGTKKWGGPSGAPTSTSNGKVTPATGTQYVPKITNPGF
ncbi:MAG: hypothetical protein IPK82_32270 [Polyangiaceae bacterium]|nr:hypothetical protein [Polyangiaceae bacterium]